MMYKLNHIEFDFDDELDYESQDEIYDDVMNQFWIADDGDDLVEEITNYSGWCIKSISYVEVE